MTFAFPALTTRQIVAGTLVVSLVGLVFWLLYRFHHVLIIFFAAVIISAAIRPFVTWLRERGVSRPLGIVVVYSALLLLIAGFIWLLAPVSVSQGTALMEALPARYTLLRQSMLGSSNYFFWRLGHELPPTLTFSGSPALPGGSETLATAMPDLQFITLVGETLFTLIATLVLAFYWTLDGQRTIRSLIVLLPINRREAARQFVAAAESRVAAFVAGQAILCLVVGALALVAYLALGLPNAFLLAVVAGLTEALPLVGPFIGAIPAVLVASSMGTGTTLAVLAATLVIQQLENQYLVPRIMKRSVGINPLITLLALMGFGLLFGVAGALVAIPLAAVFQLLLDRTVLAPPALSRESLAGRDQLSVLRYEVRELAGDLRQQIRHKEVDPSADNDYLEDAIEALAADLDSLLSSGTTAGGRP